MAQIKVGIKVRYEIMDYAFVKPKKRTVKGKITQIIGDSILYCWIQRHNSDKEDFRSLDSITIINIKNKLK